MGVRHKVPDAHNLPMTWPEIWEGISLNAVAIRTLLTPASWAYRLGWDAYASMYRLGLKKASRPHRPVICVGNLVVGGSGKTPLVVAIARRLMELGHPVVISASGYGSPSSEAAQVAPTGDLLASKWGDEPALLRVELPEIPLIVGRRRVLAAQLCAQNFPDAVMLMDDGAQHLPLARDLTLLVDPPRQNRRCLPAGPYREPRRKYATEFRGGRAVFVPGDFEVVYSALEFTDVNGEATDMPERANLLCALGNPAGFVKSVEDAGVEIAHRVIRPDHDPLSDTGLWEKFPSLPVVVTLKDWVKLRERENLGPNKIVIARRRATIEPAGRFDALLREICS